MDLVMFEETKVKLKGTQTEQNLKDAFVGESQASTKYRIFSDVAKKKAMNKLRLFLMKQQEMKKNMRRFGKDSTCWIT